MGLLKPQTCGFWMIKSPDPDAHCQCDVFEDETLKNGCNHFKGLYWNNPLVHYEELSECPDELKTTPPCWEDNGKTWPSKAPDTCKAPKVPPTPPGDCPGRT